MEKCESIVSIIGATYGNQEKFNYSGGGCILSTIYIHQRESDLDAKILSEDKK